MTFAIYIVYLVSRKRETAQDYSNNCIFPSELSRFGRKIKVAMSPGKLLLDVVIKAGR